MRSSKHRIRGLICGLTLSVSAIAPAFADDSEIYVGGVSTVKPNILLIIDTSYSMNGTDVFDRQTFNPTTNYSSNGNCTDSRIFFAAAGGPIPTCTSTDYIQSSTTWQKCDKLTTATGNVASAPAGRWTGKAGMFDATSLTWGDLLPNGPNKFTECLADAGVHGSSSGVFYARNGNATPWINSPTTQINWAQRKSYTFYSGRWLRWYYSTTVTDVNMSRLQAVKNAVNDLVSSIDDVNIGVMHFKGDSGSNGDPQYQGGVVTNAVADVTTARNTIISTVNGFTANSATPLSETLYQAGRYWAGDKMAWGDASDDPAAEDPDGTFKTPITESCQRNYNIILTDGRPTWDNEADANVGGLPGIESLWGATCTGQPGATDIGGAPATGSPPSQKNAGRCLDEMAGYLAKDTTDVLPTSMDGLQTVKTFTIGFGPEFDDNDVGGAKAFLQEVASKGKGEAKTANNSSELAEAFDQITANISNVSSTFATASIGVNSFNRAQTRNDLYFSVFNSDDHLKWDGNLKRYQLGRGPDPDGTGPLQRPFIIEGTTPGVSAVDPTTGFFKDGAQSFWSDSPDGKVVTAGGAANELPAAASRKVYTHIGTNPAAGGSFANLIDIGAAAVTDTILDTATGTPTRAEVIDFAKGGGTNAKRMGDPLHSQPVVVTYANAQTTTPDDTVFVSTNDGYLHAIDASTGIERWSFVPQELLPRLKQLMIDPATSTRTYGLDGDIRILKLDYNGNGNVDPADGDVVFLYIGMRRGGKYYYGLDVTYRDAPKLMFKIGTAELPGLGETWAPMSLARVNVSGKTQNNQKIVLIFGGGYDPVQENYTQVTDTMGNRIFMVDAKSGALLWSAGDAGRDLNLAAMTNSITGRVAVLDTDSDGYADRMYAADLGGRIFRFDIFSGSTAGSLVTGSLFAKLGNGAAAGGNDPSIPDNTNTRRFYNGPDVSLIQSRGADPYYNIAIGSGYRGHPLFRENLDRFYSLRDKQPYSKLTTNNALTPITESTPGLVNVTSNPIGAVVGPAAPGWMYVFDPSNTQNGEKVLNESVTLQGVIEFTTYAPRAASTTEPCRPTSQNRVYAMRADNGHPAIDINNDGVINNQDLSQDVVHDGILGGVNVGSKPEDSDEPPCIAGMSPVKCPKIGDKVRTYWRKNVDLP